MPFLKTKTQSHSIVTGTRTEPGFPVCHPSLPGDTHSHIQTPSKCQQSFLCNVMCMAPAIKAVVMVSLKKKKKTTTLYIYSLLFIQFDIYFNQSWLSTLSKNITVTKEIKGNVVSLMT